MKYKMIVSDYDGTLADWNGNVSKTNISAIRDYVGKGGKFAICTGRMYQSIIKQIKVMGIDDLDTPVMSFQGALITDAKGNNLYVKEMNHSTILKAVKFAKDNNKYLHMYSSEHLIISKINEHSQKYARLTKVEDCIKEVGDFEKFLKNNPKLKIIKLLMMDLPENLQKLTSDINEYLDGEAVFKHSAKYLTEAVSNDAGKGNAIKWCCSQDGLDIKNVMAVGDSMNDYTMIQDCGLGVVMGESCEELNAIADYITDTVENDGLAKVINKAINDKI